jgi:hypothetical protein
MSDETNANPIADRGETAAAPIRAFFLTLGAAARQSGLSKASVSRAIRQGKLSAIRCEETGSFKIDPAELARYLEAASVIRAQTVPTEQSVTRDASLVPMALLEERKLRELAEARLRARQVISNRF